MATIAALPTLSEVQSLDTEYLRTAADDWARAAGLWERSFAASCDRMSAPGGAVWRGQAAAAARERSRRDLAKVRGAADQLQGAAAVARRGDEQLRACRKAVLEAVGDANADGFDVGDDYSVTDRWAGGSVEFRLARRDAAEGHASFIRHRVAALVAADRQLSSRITAATEGVDALTFPEDGGVQAVDHHVFKEAPNPEPDPPPGGWSSDPLMRAAQKIAYGHAGGPDGHMADFPGMTKDQLAEVIYGKMKRASEDPGGLRLGLSSSDGAPLIYDPEDNVLIVRDPKGADCGTVFKPNLSKYPNYVAKKFGGSVEALLPEQLADGPLSGEPVRPPVGAAPARPAPGAGKGGMPGLPFGGGLPWDAPATGPHPIHPHKPGQHHRMPLLGELPDDYED